MAKPSKEIIFNKLKPPDVILHMQLMEASFTCNKLKGKPVEDCEKHKKEFVDRKIKLSEEKKFQEDLGNCRNVDADACTKIASQH